MQTHPMARWNSARGVWETARVSLVCGHSEPFLETWPTSGMTRGGLAFELPTPALPTVGSGSSLLRTPVADEDGGGPLHPDVAKERGQTLRLTGQILAHTGHLLKTPTSQLAVNGGSQHPEKRKAGGHGPTLADEVEHLLPTPIVGDAKAARNATSGRSNPESAHHLGVTLTDWITLLPTPQVADVTGGHKTRSGSRSGEMLLPGVAEYLTGGSTNPRSDGGSTSQDGWPLPPPLPMDETDNTVSPQGSWSG